MKKKLAAFIALSAIISIIIFSCKREISIPKDQFSASDAKEWYYGVFKKSEEYKTDLSVSGIKKYPDWKYGIVQQKDNYQIVEFPLKSSVRTVRVFSNPTYSEADKKRIVNATEERVVMIKDAVGNITPRIVTYIPDLDYLTKHNYDISENKVTQIDNDFNGFLFIRTWSGGFINGFKINDGRITRKLAKEFRAANEESRVEDEGSCYWTYDDVYTLTFAGHVEGDGVVWDYMSIDYQGTSDWAFQGCDGLSISPNFDPCSYGICGGSGGSGGSGTTAGISIVNNDIQNSCLNQVYNKITDASYKSKLSEMLHNFINTDQINITINANNSLADNVFGQAYLSNDNNYIIELNEDILKQCSEEFIASVYFHEAIHVYLKEHADTWDTQTSSEHLEMLGNYFGDLVAAIREVYPALPLKDSYCMILDCIENDDKDPNFAQEVFDDVKASIMYVIQSKYPDLNSESAIQAIAHLYMVGGTSGTRSSNCN
jgi:hypothetical protein